MSEVDPQAPKAAGSAGHVKRLPARIAVPTAVAASVLIGAAVAAWPGGGDGTARRGSGTVAMAATLKPFSSCDSVLAYFKEQAPDHLLERAGRGGGMVEDGDVPVSAQTRGADSTGAAEAGSTAPEHSTTNIQEAGVDEPDLVKTDGNRIVAIAQDRVHLIGVQDGRMSLRTTLSETMVRNVFLSGDRLLVFGGRATWNNEPGSRWPGQRSLLSMYDISDLGDPELIAKLTVDGEVLDARLVGTQVRVATASSPDVDAPSPIYTRSGDVSPASELALRAAVAGTTVDDWIPAYTLQDGAGTYVGRGRLVECSDLARPEAFSGLDTVAVSSFDIGSALESRQTVGVIAGGQQIYTTSLSTYVSTTDWSRDGSPARTSLHKFVTESSGASTYQGSGDVPGTLLNQYAMSEYKGVLRVASTVTERRGWVNARAATEGVVTTLGEQDGALRQLGQVGGLGREDNESIRAVRFIESRGYVVTFRQTDPLYVLDLRDATAPEVLGELKIPGYSGYLHPVGKHRLLGVGQSGAEDAPDGRPGVQFSLFDVSDPAVPRRIDTQTYRGGTAGAEFDPKAFLYWQPRNLILAPTNLYGDHNGRGAFSGVMLLRAGEQGIKEVGRLAAADRHGSVNRSLVIGDTVYLLTDQALQANSLDTHRETGRLTF